MISMSDIRGRSEIGSVPEPLATDLLPHLLELQESSLSSVLSKDHPFPQGILSE